jgi:hypothetical protein
MTTYAIEPDNRITMTTDPTGLAVYCQESVTMLWSSKR